MSNRETSGPAFPDVWGQFNEVGGQISSEEGMTLRDWFAGRYLPDNVELSLELAEKLIGRKAPIGPIEQIDFALDLQATLAYRHADAMLKARSES